MRAFAPNEFKGLDNDFFSAGQQTAPDELDFFGLFVFWSAKHP